MRFDDKLLTKNSMIIARTIDEIIMKIHKAFRATFQVLTFASKNAVPIKKETLNKNEIDKTLLKRRKFIRSRSNKNDNKIKTLTISCTYIVLFKISSQKELFEAKFIQ